MRIATKITVAVTSWTALILAMDGLVKHRESRELLQADLFDESVLAADLLRFTVDQAALDGGPLEAQRVLSRVTVGPDDVHFQLVDLRAGTHFPPAPPLSVLAPRASEAGTSPFFVQHADPALRLYTYVAVPVLGPTWRVEVSASLRDQGVLDRRFFRDTVVLIGLIMLVSASLAGWIGWSQIGQRVTALRELAEETGRGAAPRHVPVWGDDELASLSVDLNRMVDQLAEMRRRTEDEAALRSRLREQLRHADRLGAIGMMMSRVAHEIGTPLNVISARVRKIARGQADADQAREHARIAAEQTERISLVIRRMLDYSRHEGNRGEVRAAQLAEAAVGMVETLARSQDLRLQIVDESNGARVAVDPVLIEQSLVNLLINAISVSPAGGTITVGVGAVAGTADAVEKATVCLSVQDEGPGVPPALQAQIFEPFFTTKPVGEGTGLGLAISSTIVSEHGGQLRLVETARGARFEIVLPAAGREPASRPPR